MLKSQITLCYVRLIEGFAIVCICWVSRNAPCWQLALGPVDYKLLSFITHCNRISLEMNLEPIGCHSEASSQTFQNNLQQQQSQVHQVQQACHS